MATYIDRKAGIPPSQLRGNSNAHYRTRAKYRKEMKERARERGAAWLADGNDPLKPPYSALVLVGSDRIDLDNMLMGFKSYWDGLEDYTDDDGVKRAGVIGDDKHIIEITVRRDKTVGRNCHILLREDY